MQILLSRVQTCPVNLCLEWLGVVGKVKGHGLEYGFVKYRVLYYDVGSFFLCPTPTLSLPLSSGISWGAEHEVVLGKWPSPAWALGSNVEWA